MSIRRKALPTYDDLVEALELLAAKMDASEQRILAAIEALRQDLTSAQLAALHKAIAELREEHRRELQELHDQIEALRTDRQVGN